MRSVYCYVIVLVVSASEVAGLVAAETVAVDVADAVYLLDGDLMIKMPDGLSDIYSHNALWCHTCSM